MAGNDFLLFSVNQGYRLRRLYYLASEKWKNKRQTAYHYLIPFEVNLDVLGPTEATALPPPPIQLFFYLCTACPIPPPPFWCASSKEVPVILYIYS